VSDKGEPEVKSLPLDASQFRFLAVSEPEVVTDFNTKAPKLDRNGQPVFSLDVLFTREGHKGEVVTVKVAGEKPTVSEGQKLRLSNLEATPWENNGRTGVSFTASKIEPATAASKAA
jgi:hypothetical protein